VYPANVEKPAPLTSIERLSALLVND